MSTRIQTKFITKDSINGHIIVLVGLGGRI